MKISLQRHGLRLLSFLFWLGAGVYFLVQWLASKSSFDLGFTCLFLLLAAARGYQLSRELRVPDPSIHVDGIERNSEHAKS